MFEIWHTESNNIIDSFDTAAEAQETIIAAMRTRGEHIFDGAYMIRVDDSGQSHFVGEGRAIPVAITIYQLLDALREESESGSALIRESLRDSAISDYLRSLPNLERLGVEGSRELMQGVVIGGLLARLPSVFPRSGAGSDSSPASGVQRPVSGSSPT
jgi:hypothetical protein